MKNGLRIGLIAGGGLIALALIAVIVMLFVYPAEYLRRLVTYGESDVLDYQIFPERSIQAAAEPLPFKPAADAAGGSTTGRCCRRSG